MKKIPMFFHSLRLRAAGAALLLFFVALQVPAFAAGDASDGHAHDAAPVAASGPALPRFSAQSELFEVVGVLNASELSMLIDHYESNAPVLGAKLEIESGTFKAVVPFHADLGDYAIAAQPFKNPGTYAITLTITAGDQTDLLAGELVVPGPETAHAGQAHASHWPDWLAGAAVFFALAVTALWSLRKLRARRSVAKRIEWRRKS